MSSSPKRPTIWSTASLRLALAFSLLFGLGGAALVAAVDIGLMRFAEAEVREGLRHQMAVMRADAERHGGSVLVQELNAQPRNRDARRYLLLVQTPDGSVFSNGLTRAAVNESGFRRNLPSKGRAARWPDQTPNMLVLSEHASDGTLLAVGRDTQHLDDLRGGVRAFALWSGLALSALAILGGLVVGWLFLRRMEAVNRAVGRIIAGRDAERLPAIGFGREFDDLAANLNRMLDRQQAAIDALKALSEGVAHELRAPLNRLRNRLEEVQAGAADPATRDEAVHLAMEEVDRLSGLFESLLTLARVETGAARLDRRRLDARDLARRVGEIYEAVVEASGAVLVQDIASDGALEVQGDAVLLQQALANLIENAAFHAGEAPRITVSAGVRGDQAILAVSDDGPGVPEAERDKVLARFYRLEPGRSRTGAGAGAGLGLPLAAAVARAHGGELVLLDNMPGLRAELRLPLARGRDDAG